MDQDGEKIITIKPGGILELPAKLTQSLELKGNDQFKVVVMGKKLVQLLKVDEDFSRLIQNDDKIVMTGDLEGVGITDLFSILNMSQKTGVLVLVSEKAYKAIYFRRGEIVFASSNQPEERLGNILYRTGKISQEQKEEAERSLTGDKRFGTILLERKLISPKDLWWGVRYQMEEIIYSSFHFLKGFFFFIEGDLADEDLVRFSFNTQKLLMEGFRRMDEWPLIYQLIPSRDAVLEISAAPGAGELNPIMQKVFEIVDGKKKVGDVIRLSQLGEFNAFRILYQLAKAGIIRAKEKAREVKPDKAEADRKRIITVVEKYNLLFRQMQTAIGNRINLPDAVADFFGDLSPRFKKLFEGLKFGPDGSLDPEKLLENSLKAGMLEVGAFQKLSSFCDLFAFQLALDGLNEFLNFLIFSLRNISGDDKEIEDVIRRVRAAQSQIQGRKNC
ncbi:MAG: DUF4388 domain-containing protein [Proteobacteria bacterium]|nr:DUF4388 domain-containing protein [Pseudomonadota bacterium]